MGDYSRTDVFEAVRIWLEEAIDVADFAWFDADKILNEPVNGPRPDTNYLTLQMIAMGEREGTGDYGRQHDFPQQVTRAIVRVQAFGSDAVDALTSAFNYIYHDEIRLLVEAQVRSERRRDRSRGLDSLARNRYGDESGCRRDRRLHESRATCYHRSRYGSGGLFRRRP
jgi:predicted alpha-1,6-mannanase (GH76 family)